MHDAACWPVAMPGLPTRPLLARNVLYVMSSAASCGAVNGRMPARTSRAALAVAADADPDAFGIVAQYGSNRSSNDCTASWMAMCTFAMSTIDAGPRGDVIVLATSFQNVTASAAPAAVAHPVDIRAVKTRTRGVLRARRVCGLSV